MPWLAFERDWTWRPNRRWLRVFKTGTVTLQPRACATAAVAAGVAKVVPSSFAKASEDKMDAGKKRDLVAFDVRASGFSAQDGAGNFEGGWQEQFTAWAEVKHLRGREEIVAQRLQGVQPVSIVVRSSVDARRITTDWRARIRKTGAIVNLRSVAPDEIGADIHLLGEIGTADG